MRKLEILIGSDNRASLRALRSSCVGINTWDFEIERSEISNLKFYTKRHCPRVNGHALYVKLSLWSSRWTLWDDKNPMGHILYRASKLENIFFTKELQCKFSLPLEMIHCIVEQISKILENFKRLLISPTSRDTKKGKQAYNVQYSFSNIHYFSLSKRINSVKGWCR